MIAPEAVLEAAAQIAGHAHHTPVLSSTTLNHQTQFQVFFKCENFQRVGAFKFRGAYNAISRLDEQERRAGVITHSSGNHAQGIALAARLLDVKATVVMPEDAPPNKRQATAAYGATIVPCDALVREEVTARLIEENGYTLIHPFDNPHIIAGQGTAALELFDEVGPLDYLFVPVGGGGLISGSALAAQLRARRCRVVGVEPAAGDDAGRSWRSGEIIRLDTVPDTIADGLRTRAIGHLNIEIMRRYVSDMTSVSEAEIMAATEYIWSRLKIIVEPSAAVALAPILSGHYEMPPGSRIGVLLSGGNVSLSATQALARPAVQASAGLNVPPAKVAVAGDARERKPSRLLVCAPIEQQALNTLQEVGEVDIIYDADEETLISRIGDYHALIASPNQRINSHVIKYGYNLKAIGSLDGNLDKIDVSAARALGIQICYAPDSRAVTIAEHTVGRLLALANRFSDGRLAGKTLGLIGFGLVGRQVAQRAAAFDMRILVNQPRLTPELVLDSGVESADLVYLLQHSDFISLHVPFSEETEAIIGPEELSLMKPGALLVNTGHTDLVDEKQLLAALDAGLLAGAALSSLPPVVVHPTEYALALRNHEHVIISPHISSILSHQMRDHSLDVARQIVSAVSRRRASETLDLEIVPVERIVPHEAIDMKRVARLVERLEDDGKLVNPPVTTFWKDRYIILDGATRYSALCQLDYRHAIVQVVDKDRTGFQLHTWYHAISAEEPQNAMSFNELAAELEKIKGLRLRSINADESQGIFSRPEVICYFIDREGGMTLAEVEPGISKLAVMNSIVDAYNAWGAVERTLLTDVERLIAQFPQLVGVAVYPQFQPEEVFDAAAEGILLPAGLTRFVIPGRILRLNADLARLKRDEPLAEKRAWFNDFLAGKLSRSRLRVYQEPVVLLDE
ncbi:MAG: pyridoxal-phosphate dependent enzyme [Candidatus Promineofilum sp.]|nr:pyridoxal-phosphate dependent enzyme [Promineifilum sp.]